MLVELSLIKKLPWWAKVSFSVGAGIVLGCLIGEIIYQSLL